MERIEVDIYELIDALKPSGLPDFTVYQYYKNLQNRKIIINEQISDTLLELAVLPFMEMDNDGSGKPIEIILSTVGGNIYDGFNLIDQIEKAKSPVIIHVMAMAASMGLLITMAGKNNPNVKSVCHPFSIGLLHSGSQCMEGSTHAVKDTFNFSQQYEEKIKDYILTHTKIDEDTYEKVERKEYWMDSTEMLKLGIVDEIL